MTAYVTSPLIAAVTKLDLTGPELVRLVAAEDRTVPAAREAPSEHQYLEQLLELHSWFLPASPARRSMAERGGQVQGQSLTRTRRQAARGTSAPV